MESLKSFLSDRKRKTLWDLLAASRKKLELLKKELIDFETESKAKIEQLDERINESAAALECLRRNNEAEMLAKQKELDDVEAEFKIQFEMLAEMCLRRKNDPLEDVRRDVLQERDRMVAARKIDLAGKQRELDDLAVAHKEKTKAAEEEHKKLVQERKNMLKEHAKEIARVKGEHKKMLVNEKNEFARAKKEVLENHRKIVKNAIEFDKIYMNAVFEAQKMKMDSDFQKILMDSFCEILHHFLESMEACKQLRDILQDTDEEAEMKILFAREISSEWTVANDSTRDAAQNLRDLIDRYTTKDLKLQEKINSVLPAIGNKVADNHSLILYIERHVSNEEIGELQSLLPQVVDCLAQLEQVAETAGNISAPRNDHASCSQGEK